MAAALLPLLMLLLSAANLASSVIPPAPASAPIPAIPSPSSSPSPSVSPTFLSPDHPPLSPPAPFAPEPTPVPSPSPSPSPSPTSTPSPAPSPAADLIREGDGGNVGDSGDSSRGLSGGQKAGIAVGVVAAAAAVGLGSLVYKKRRENIGRARFGYNNRREMI